VAQDQPVSAWAPFRHRAFAILWVATVVSNVGTWMHDIGAGWLMTELSASPLLVAAVQAATTLPVFLFALVAGAVADIVDRRRLLLRVNAAMAAVAATLALLVLLDAASPALLLIFTFLMGLGVAFVAPAWQAIVPRLVPRAELQPAIALNSLGINLARAIGPALSGFLIVAVGLAAPFFANALSFLVIIAALWRWKPEPAPPRRLPPEHLGAAVWAGLRYAANARPVQATLLRSAAFFLPASALWSMLPLIVRVLLEAGPTFYGVLLGCLGAGAIAGALVLPAIRRRLGLDRTVAAGTIGLAGVLVLLALWPQREAALAAAALAGICWIAVLSSLNLSAQTALPDWVRARGLSLFLTVFFGTMALGSVAWGNLAAATSIPTTLLAGAGLAVLLVPLTWRARLGQGEGLDLTVSLHWPATPVLAATEHERGPVLVQAAYLVDPADAGAFVALLDELKHARRRGGGYGWTLMQDAAAPRRWLEGWYESSWLQHLRHHERVTGADKALQERILALHRGEAPPEVRHLLTAGRGAPG